MQKKELNWCEPKSCITPAESDELPNYGFCIEKPFLIQQHVEIGACVPIEVNRNSWPSVWTEQLKADHSDSLGGNYEE